jgi:hypothetical protein
LCKIVFPIFNPMVKKQLDHGGEVYHFPINATKRDSYTFKFDPKQ